MRVYCVWPLNRSWLLLVTLCWLRRQQQVKCWRVRSFCPTLNAPLNFNSPDESWVISFAQLWCSLFSFLFMHDVCLHLISPFLHLNPPQTYFLPLSILFFFYLKCPALYFAHTQWAFNHSLLLFLSLPKALQSISLSWRETAWKNL